MPTIPTYDGAQVRNATLQGGFLDANAFGAAGARQIGQAGEALQRVGSAGMDVAFKIQQRDDQAKADELYTQLTREHDQAQLEWSKRTGTKAEGLTGEAEAWWKDAESRFAKDLSPQQAQMLAQKAGQIKTISLRDTARFELKEKRDGQVKAAIGVIDTEVSNAAKDPANSAVYRGNILEKVTQLRDIYGWDKEVADAERRKYLTQMHTAVIDGFLKSNNPAEAEKYFSAASGLADFDGVTANKIRGEIDKVARSVKASETVEAVWKGFGPGSDTEAVNLDAMVAELRKEYKSDPEGLKVAMADLKDRASVHDYSVRQREAQVTGGIYQRVLAGESLATIRNSEEFRSLDGGRQLQMVEKIEAFRKRGQDGEGEQMDKFASYWALASNPKKLAGMSDAEIFAMTPKVGATLVKQLLSDKQKLAKGDDKVIDATIDNDQFKYWAGKAGMDTSPKKDSDGEKTLGELKYRVEALIDSEQRRLGRPLQRKEKDDIMKRLTVEVPVRYKQKVFGVERTGVENRRLFTVQNPDAIVIQGADRESVVKALKSVGIQNPTEAQIREGYVRLKAQ